MNYKEYLESHEKCVSAMRAYFVEAETTSEMLGQCMPEALSFDERFVLFSQEIKEHEAHVTYVGCKRVLHAAALLGYGLPN
jgi:hypothetical protein